MDEKNPEFNNMQFLLRILRGLPRTLHLSSSLNNRHLCIQQEAGCCRYWYGYPGTDYLRNGRNNYALLLLNMRPRSPRSGRKGYSGELLSASSPQICALNQLNPFL